MAMCCILYTGGQLPPRYQAAQHQLEQLPLQADSDCVTSRAELGDGGQEDLGLADAMYAHMKPGLEQLGVGGAAACFCNLLRASRGCCMPEPHAWKAISP